MDVDGPVAAVAKRGRARRVSERMSLVVDAETRDEARRVRLDALERDNYDTVGGVGAAGVSGGVAGAKAASVLDDPLSLFEEDSDYVDSDCVLLHPLCWFLFGLHVLLCGAASLSCGGLAGSGGHATSEEDPEDGGSVSPGKG